jgi:hypothetical protein
LYNSGSYLTNLCNPDPAKRQKSYENLLDELKVMTLLPFISGSMLMKPTLQRAEDLGIGLFNIQYD